LGEREYRASRARCLVGEGLQAHSVREREL
jgi:hypothetical protein